MDDLRGPDVLPRGECLSPLGLDGALLPVPGLDGLSLLGGPRVILLRGARSGRGSKPNRWP